MQRLTTSYRQILTISLPIMLGSAVQNIIALTDSVFLYYVSETDFAAIGFVGVFYLVIAAIGYSLSKGGQIIIARRMGEHSDREAGRSFYAMIYFAMALALIMFLFMQWYAAEFFAVFIQTPDILQKSVEYIEPRSYGVFFGYVGVACIALYTGLARTSFIIIDTIILAVVNIVLNYGLIYGAWGLPEMGIAGAGLASSIAEAIALVVFIVFMLYDRGIRPLRIFSLPLPRIDLNLVGRLLSLSSPVVLQSVIGLGSWFVFFGLIENMGQRQLAISNLARIIYLVLSIPCWGYASGINTLVSNFMGRQKKKVVFPIIFKTAKITFWTTMAISIPVLVWPEFFLYPLLGARDVNLMTEAQPIFLLLIPILALFSWGGVYINGLTGTGATGKAMLIQALSALCYLGYIYFAVRVFHMSLFWVWFAEIIYWLITIGMTHWYLYSRRWWRMEV